MRRRHILCHPDTSGEKVTVEVLNCRYDFITIIGIEELKKRLTLFQQSKLDKYLLSNNDTVSLVFQEI